MNTSRSRPPLVLRSRGTRRLEGRLVAAGSVLLLAALLGCGADSPASDAEAAGGEAAMAGRAGPATTSESDAPAPGQAFDTRSGGGADRAPARAAAQVRERAVIASGAVGLRSDDVAESRDDVRALLDQLDGQLAEEESRTTEDGTLQTVRMVLRVPSGSFDAAMTGLAEVADVVQQTRSTEDVTTQVIDTEVRIRAQRRSITRIEMLLDRAETLGEVVRVESELTRRQADLDSLLAQQEWLGDQTSLATIRLTVRAEDLDEAEDDVHEAGFAAGLRAGWDALADAAVVTSTVVGALLPWAVLVAVLGVPLTLVLRRRRPSAPTAAPGE